MNGPIDIPVRLLPGEPVLPANATSIAAWLLPGDDPLRWLEELVAWGDDLVDIDCLVIGRGDDGRIHGLLAIAPAHKKSMPPLGARCFPYVAPVPRCFIPADAKLDPPLAGAALSKLLPSSECLYVWHPTAGWIAFEPPQTLRAPRLLGPIAPAEVAWDRAVPGTALNGRLHSIEPAIAPNADQTISGLGGDIGEKGSSLADLPPDPNEPTAMQKFGQSLMGNAARAISGIAGWMQSLAKAAGGGNPTHGKQTGAGHTGAGSGGAKGWGWLDAIQKWADDRWQQLAQHLEEQRHKELSRLMKMLERDPDAGLQYAIPFTNDGGLGRGIAPPGATLGRRNVDFNLSGLGGGQAIDAWDAGDFRQKLIARYRELASREIALGRHRRAAYIFAQLLGDLNSAAKTLEDGKHYREAAILYEHKLKNPQAAARCYRSGGLWSEALELYERLHEFETIGDLHRQLSDEEAARFGYLRALEQRLTHDDPLAAARIANEKLRDPERSLSILWGWPASKQASAALREAVRIAGSLGRHDEVRHAVERIARRAIMAPERLPDAVEEMASVCESYPDPRVRSFAESSARNVVAERLEDAPPSEVARLTKALARLVPSDKLLATDCRNYTARRAPANPPAIKRQPIERIGQWSLPEGVAWSVAGGSYRNWVAAGWQNGILHVVRGTWSGQMQELPEAYRGLTERPLLLAIHPAGVHKVLLHPIGTPTPLVDRAFPAIGGEFEETVTVGGHDSFDAATQAAAYAGAGRLIVARFDEPEIRAHEYTTIAGAITGGGITFVENKYALLEENPEEAEALIEAPVLLGHHGTTAWLASHRLLCQARPVWSCLAGQSVKTMAVTFPRQQQGVAIGFETGAMYLGASIGARDKLGETFAYDLASPKLAFIGGGYLVAAGDRGIEVNAVESRGLRVHGSLAEKLDDVIAVLPSIEPAEFGVINRAGALTHYRIR